MMMKIQHYLSKGVKRLTSVNELLSYKFHVSPGHYYSPYISTEAVKQYEQDIFSAPTKEIPAIDLNEDKQLSLLQEFPAYYQHMPFSAEKQENLRYYYDNEYYSYSDATMLHCMIRHFQPRKIIEIGSGFSSAMMLDTNQLFFDNSIQLTFVEPYPERLQSILRKEDNIHLYEKNVQDIGLDLFSSLQENDILFIDSSHVVKTGSDVNYILFKILPVLPKGVKIHFHDIFFPFEYPKEWVLNYQRNWNEDYFLRAFLMYNDTFKIALFNTFLEQYYRDWFATHMPLCLKNLGASLWLSKEK